MTEKLKQILYHTNSVEKGLYELSLQFKGKIAFSSSFGMEDQVITHAIATQKIKNIEIFTLDTGRLFPETYKVWDKNQLKYNQAITAYYPKTEVLENYISTQGINAFYTSVELRKECCHIRKVEPLQRALQDVKIWITGLRAEQSQNRQSLEKIQWDENFQLFKYNPLLEWTWDEVQSYIEQNKVPYNSLHNTGFNSIGCAPCTRAVAKNEDSRAGRWWWENEDKKECGLHQ